ncbi:stachyose synthase-like [Pyrus ussuriensis x Pyrus communis]|uniref:Stachyose synthase-like n=1 Tax=Pyrus ussuriensis x Pyrus communis TaxID=2448454 RepID=A0A5N5GX75_9ROSA|nr:stachyose synthase-like [Pyrus ussuriensis x Pyrus communis]
MAPPNLPVNPINDVSLPEIIEEYFDLSDGKLSVRGVPLLDEVPNNVTFSPFNSICQPCDDVPLPLLNRVGALPHKGGFLGFKADVPSDRLKNSLGRSSDRDFLSIFRFKTWWSTMWVGNSGSNLQKETQWVLFDVPEIKSYVIIIPIIDGSFRSALQPGTDGHVVICAESGSTQVKASNFDAIAYVHASDNPYNLMKEAFSAIRVHLNTFRLLEEKTVPNLVDKFGWCTWDAFYLTVEPAGIWHGINEFTEAGVSPRFLIVDDGWQSISFDENEDPNEDAKNLVLCGSQMLARLHRFDECKKFRNYKGGSMLSPNAPSFDPKRPKMLIAKAIEIEQAEKTRDKAVRSGVTDLSVFETKIQKLQQELSELLGGQETGASNGSCRGCTCRVGSYGLKAFTSDLRSNFKGLDDIYVWHALCGAWCGVKPGATHLNAKITPCILPPGLDGTMNDLAVDKVLEGGMGLVHPDHASLLYDSMHSYLSEVGVTGVKVDVIHILEYVSEEHGGRVELAKAYYKGLSDSLVKNFNGSGLISSMQQCNDFFFLGTRQISMGRAGDDFWFQDPSGDPMGVYWLQGVHMIHCSYNSMWMGQMIVPDWDMFQSDHLCAKYHAGSRAICGGPVYLSDFVGSHDFDLIKKLVHPDGTVPNCLHCALPTRDCLFKNPLFDGKTALKIWNFNKFGGVIGGFNCQGAGWDPKEQRIKGFPDCYKPILCSVHVSDIEWDQNLELAHMGKAEEYIVHLNQDDELRVLTPKSAAIQITIQPSSFEIFTIVPVQTLSPGNKFAPVGLTNMFNSGGSIQELEYTIEGEVSAKVKVKGGGSFLAYASGCPKKCCLNGGEVAFEWSDKGKLKLNLPWVEEAAGISELVFMF